MVVHTSSVGAISHAKATCGGGFTATRVLARSSRSARTGQVTACHSHISGTAATSAARVARTRAHTTAANSRCPASTRLPSIVAAAWRMWCIASTFAILRCRYCEASKWCCTAAFSSPGEGGVAEGAAEGAAGRALAMAAESAARAGGEQRRGERARARESAESRMRRRARPSREASTSRTVPSTWSVVEDCGALRSLVEASTPSSIVLRLRMGWPGRAWPWSVTWHCTSSGPPPPSTGEGSCAAAIAA
mmetsp:Transcript_22563/g.49429  ORF Transcript_22563/g.49429 Transcript_22563/m.49429 type:complete len:249 (+) Transcript_22563:412-1158(+)